MRNLVHNCTYLFYYSGVQMPSISVVDDWKHLSDCPSPWLSPWSCLHSLSPHASASHALFPCSITYNGLLTLFCWYLNTYTLLTQPDIHAKLHNHVTLVTSCYSWPLHECIQSRDKSEQATIPRPCYWTRRTSNKELSGPIPSTGTPETCVKSLPTTSLPPTTSSTKQPANTPLQQLYYTS